MTRIFIFILLAAILFIVMITSFLMGYHLGSETTMDIDPYPIHCKAEGSFDFNMETGLFSGKVYDCHWGLTKP